jgi:hypothetical protein
MRKRPVMRLRPGLERLGEKRLPSAGPSTAHAALHEAGAGGPVHPQSADGQAAPAAGLTLFRITNPKFPDTVNLVPPFQQVLVQSTRPVPGQVYNVLSLAVKNGTARTFDASSGFAVRLATSGPGVPRAFPILTGTEQWKPGQFIVFYILTKKYYPVNPITGAGFQFNFAPGLVAIPGPSGIFLRLTYNPATFARTLDWIVAFGPGAQGGKGPPLGLPDTSIWEFVSAKTDLVPL